MAAKYELKAGSNGQFVFNLKSGNGETILTGESYLAKSGALGGIESVRKNSPLDERFERNIPAQGQPSFTLKAGNGEPIGRSETYSSVASMENGIASVKENGPTAIVNDLT